MNIAFIRLIRPTYKLLLDLDNSFLSFKLFSVIFIKNLFIPAASCSVRPASSAPSLTAVSNTLRPSVKAPPTKLSK